MATVDTAELFREYLESQCSEDELVQWVMRHLDHANFGMTDVTRAMFAEAISYQCTRELVEQVVLNEQDRRAHAGYRRWCRAALEADEEQRVREGAVY